MWYWYLSSMCSPYHQISMNTPSENLLLWVINILECPVSYFILNDNYNIMKYLLSWCIIFISYKKYYVDNIYWAALGHDWSSMFQFRAISHMSSLELGQNAILYTHAWQLIMYWLWSEHHNLLWLAMKANASEPALKYDWL